LGKIAVQKAAKADQRGALLWLRESDCFSSITVRITAVEQGNLELLKWLKDHNGSFNFDTTNKAAQNGALEILKWLIANGCGCCEDLHFMLRSAVILKCWWMMEIGVAGPWSASVSNTAATPGNLEILKWLVEQGCPLDPSEVMLRAVSEGYLHVIKWVAEFNDVSLLWTPRHLFDYGASSRNLDVMKWLKERNYLWCAKTCAQAAGNRHLEALKRLRENQCSWDATTASFTFKNGHFKVLKWSVENGCLLDHERSRFASDLDLLDLLKWLCSWHSNVVLEAAKHQNFEMFKWAMENGFPYPLSILNSDAEIRCWAEKHGIWK